MAYVLRVEYASPVAKLLDIVNKRCIAQHPDTKRLFTEEIPRDIIRRLDKIAAKYAIGRF